MSPKNIVLTVFLFVSTFIHAQSVGSKNAEWVYDFQGSAIGVTKFKVSGDTTVNGVTYQRMEKRAIRQKDYGEIVEYPRLPFYFRQESGLLLYTGNFTFEDTLYNFNAGINASWNLPRRNYSGQKDGLILTFTVVDTFQTDLNGVSVLSQAVEIGNSINSNFTVDTLFENIGSRNYLFLVYDWPPPGIEGGDRGVLRSFSNDVLGAVDFLPFHEASLYADNLSGFEYDCDALSSTEGTQSSSSFSVYPNPTNQFLTITSSEQRIDQIVIYNLNGVLVNSYELDHTRYELDVSRLPAGVYFVQINALTFEKIVILSTSP